MTEPFRLAYYRGQEPARRDDADRAVIEFWRPSEQRWVGELHFHDPLDLGTIRIMRLMEMAYQRGRQDR